MLLLREDTLLVALSRMAFALSSVTPLNFASWCSFNLAMDALEPCFFKIESTHSGTPYLQ